MSTESQSKRKSDRLPLKEVPGLIKDSFLEFFEEDGLFHGAALAYYTVFAMVPLLYLCIVYFGKVIGHDVMLQIIEDLLRNKVGIEDVTGIMQFLKQLNFQKGNFFMEMVGIIVLLVTSSAFIVCLKRSINDFFDLHINYSSKKRKIYKNVLFRLISLAMVAAITVLVILFYFAQAIVMSMSDEVLQNYHWLDVIISAILRHGLAIVSNAFLFTMVFKYVHDGYVKWKLAIGGALLTSVLLYLGQLFIKYYLFNFFFGAKSGGIAGTLFILLAWVYYSSQIIFFGAKFTAVYAKKVGKPIRFQE
jgi:membrane protein